SPLPGNAGQLELIARSVDRPQTFVHVVQPDAAVQGVLQPLSAHAQAIVVDLDNRVAVLHQAANHDPPSADLSRQTVLDRVLDKRLQQHARNDDVERVWADLLDHLQLWTEADDLDVQIFIDGLELLTKAHEMIRASKQPAEQPRELGNQHPGRLGLRSNQGRDRRQGVEQEVRVDLVGERLDSSREQQRFLFLQPVLDPRVVPDLDWRGHTEDCRQQHAKHRPRDRRIRWQGEQPVMRSPANAEDLAQQLEPDRRQQQDDLPVHLQGSKHL